MAVTSVTESWDERRVSIRTDGVDAVRVYDVVFDGTDSPQVEIVLACYASDGSTAVPRMWTPHPFDAWLYVGSIIPRPIGPHTYKVEVNYKVASSESREESPFLNPLDQPPEVEIDFVAFNEPIDRDIYGNAITNSADESPDPPLTEDFYDLLIRITRNEASFDHVKAAYYMGSVNNAPWWNFDAGSVKVARFAGRQMRAAALVYVQVIYEFQIRFAEYAGIYYGWKRRVLDQGFREKTGTDSSGKPTYKLIKDDDEVPVNQPVLLDGEGNKLAAGAEPVFRTWETKRRTDFSQLYL